MNLVKPCLLAAALLALAPMASAANKTATFGVQLVVQNACTLTAGGGAADMNFLSVTGNIAADILASTSLGINCNSGAVYHIGLDNGQHASGAQRRMMSGTQAVNYGLYQNVARDVAWGATSSTGTATDYDGVGTNATQTISVYGLVPTGQSVGAGTYTDTITATVEF